MTAGAGNAALEQQLLIGAVKKCCAGCLRSESNRDSATHIPAADGVWDARSPVPEIASTPIRVFYRTHKKQMDFRKGRFRKLGKHAVQFVERGAGAGTKRMQKDEQSR